MAITTHIAIPMVLTVYPHVIVGVAWASPSPQSYPLIDSLPGYGHAMDTIGHTQRPLPPKPP
jgi:hypothetical protein